MFRLVKKFRDDLKKCDKYVMLMYLYLLYSNTKINEPFYIQKKNKVEHN